MLTTNPILEDISKVTQPTQHIAKEGTSSHPAFIEEEEEKEKVVEVFDSEDEFDIFDQIQPSLRSY